MYASLYVCMHACSVYGRLPRAQLRQRWRAVCCMSISSTVQIYTAGLHVVCMHVMSVCILVRSYASKNECCICIHFCTYARMYESMSVCLSDCTHACLHVCISDCTHFKPPFKPPARPLCTPPYTPLVPCEVVALPSPLFTLPSTTVHTYHNYFYLRQIYFYCRCPWCRARLRRCLRLSSSPQSRMHANRAVRMCAHLFYPLLLLRFHSWRARSRRCPRRSLPAHSCRPSTRCTGGTG